MLLGTEDDLLSLFLLCLYPKRPRLYVLFATVRVSPRPPSNNKMVLFYPSEKISMNYHFNFLFNVSFVVWNVTKSLSLFHYD